MPLKVLDLTGVYSRRVSVKSTSMQEMDPFAVAALCSAVFGSPTPGLLPAREFHRHATRQHLAIH
jgi:hypothetical protein